MIEKTSTEIAAEKERLELQKLPNPYRRNCTAINKETVYPNILQRRTQIMNPLTSLRNQRVHQIRK